MPKISVIIPNYNHERFLAKRLNSVLDQSFKDFEIIILDDCSTDDSKKVIEKFRSNEKVSKIVYNDENSGSTFKQWKKGIQLAVGDYVWIAESDDFSDPEFLAVVVTPLLNDAAITVSFCRSVNVDENENVLGITLHADQLDKVKWTKDYVEEGAIEIDRYLRYRNTIPNASAVIFKKPTDIDRFLNTDMRFCGDWLFWLNLLRLPGAKIAYSPKTLNFFRTHSGTTRSMKSDLDMDLEIRRFKEYKSFVPLSFLNPFDERYRWMMAEWIDRGLSEHVKNTRFQYFPLLHPALIVRYYLYLAKKYLTKKAP